MARNGFWRNARDRASIPGMNGIRIYGKPAFRELFSPIFPALVGLTWVTEPDAFRLPLEWLDESSYDEAAERFTSGPCAEFERNVPLLSYGRGQYGRCSTADIFAAYAGIVNEDWNAIFGLRAPVDVAVDWLKGYFDATDRVAHVAKAHVCFFNVDGAFWEFYAHDEELIRSVRRHLETLDVSVQDCVLRDAHHL